MKRFFGSIVSYVRNIPRRILIWTMVALGLIVLVLTLFAVRKGFEKRLYEQHAFLSWSELGEDQGQLSVFYPYDHRLDDFARRQLEYDVRQELIKESVIDEDARGFITCASASGKVNIARVGGKPIEANAIGTLGDFFRFHPLKIVNGYTYTDDILTPDMVMIDEDLAWQLFGSVEVCGQQIEIGGVTHNISGVFSIDKKGSINKSSGIPDNLVLLSLYSLCQLGSVDGAQGPEDNGADAAAVGTAKLYGMSTWEIVMPDPVKNYALNVIKKVLGEKTTAVIVYNSMRYDPEYLSKNAGFLLTGGMQTKPMVFPYWENIALGWGNVFTILWFIQVVFTIASVLILSVVLILLWRRRTWTFSGLWSTLMDKKYELESRMASTHDKWEHF